MKIFKREINLIIRILLVFSVILAMLAIFIKVTLLNKNTYFYIFDKNNVYKEVTEVIYNKIDAVLNSKSINYDIKKSIITEEDIKKESDKMISSFIDYLKTGENNIKSIDGTIYKKRVKDIINSFKGNAGGKLQNQNIVFTETNNFELNNMVYLNKKGNEEQSTIIVKNLMSREEAEKRVRQILKEKGLTEEEAIKKAREKGITQEQALKILADYGIVIDDMPSDAKNKNTQKNDIDNHSNNGTSSNKSSAKNSDKNDNKALKSDGYEAKTKNAQNSIIDNILNKVYENAANNIEKEISKMNLNKILKLNKFKILARIITAIYKMFWLIIILPFVLTLLLLRINHHNISYGFRYIRNAFLFAGSVLSIVFFSAYIFKIYDKVNIINGTYMKIIASYTIKNLLMFLSIYGIITFLIGGLMYIPSIIRHNQKNNRPVCQPISHHAASTKSTNSLTMSQFCFLA